MKAARVVATALALATVAAFGTAFFLVTTTFTQATQDSSLTDTGSCAAVVNAAAGTADLDREQLDNAKTIVTVGLEMHVPARGLVVAIATTLQESHLRNLSYGDRDSVGLFQQRPSAGWGSVAQLTDPPTASRKFFSALLKIPSWQAMSVTQAAQAVQRSAFPFAYAKWESLATTLVGKMIGIAPGRLSSSTVIGIECGSVVGNALAPGAVAEMLTVARQQLGKPYVWGGTGPDFFDCSGLVVYSWSEIGYPLSVRTSEQMYRVSRTVPAGSEKAGDLLFGDFSTAGPGHVMIVIQPGVAIEAPHTGDVVKIVTYDSTKWTIGRLGPSAFMGQRVPS